MSLYPKQLKFEESKRSGFKGFATHHTIKAPKNQTSDPKMFLVVVKQNVLEKFKPQTKIRVVLRARMKHAVPAAVDKTITEVRTFQSKIEIVLESTDLDELWIEMCEQVLENLSKFEKSKGSGWSFDSIVSLHIHTAKYRPLTGGSYVKLPKFLEDKTALINMKFRNACANVVDKQCFNWCVTRFLILLKYTQSE